MIVLWLSGLVTAHTMGGLIHILLVIAIIMVLVRHSRAEDLVGGEMRQITAAPQSFAFRNSRQMFILEWII